MVQRFGRTTSQLYAWKDNDKKQDIIVVEEELNTAIHELEASPLPTTTTMQSPLPDSSALEAGILEDSRPSRLSRVQDNVRNLLRTSVFGSVKSSPTSPTYPPRGQTEVLSSPQRQHHQQPEVLPSPTSTTSSTTHYTSSRVDGTFIPAQSNSAPHFQPQPPSNHQSTLFNTRAVAALNHPDLSDPSLATFSQQKRQVRKQKSAASGWTRSSRKRKRAAVTRGGARGLLCLLAALLLAALVATYVTLATASSGLSTTFHVLFVLGICLATIVFAYSIIQLVFIGRRSRSQQPLFIAVSRHGNQRRHHHHHHRRPEQQRTMPTLTGENDFVPSMPIPVHLSSDDIRIHADPLPAQPTAGAEIASQEPWDKDAEELPNPPPAYGRWRESVRANPELLHWQAVPSPVTPSMPSPTYEEAVREEGAAPPSYRTRESPARQREMREARAGIARSQVVEPEMVEARGQGVGVGLAM